jgi:hypothetical protein
LEGEGSGRGGEAKELATIQWIVHGVHSWVNYFQYLTDWAVNIQLYSVRLLTDHRQPRGLMAFETMNLDKYRPGVYFDAYA